MIATTAKAAKSAPRLSVTIPFYRDDPSALVRALDAQRDGLSEPVEIVLCDDGSGQPELSRSVESLAANANTPVRIVTLPENRGRAAARNALAEAASGEWLLYLDADMTVPDGFLANWLEVIAAGDCDAAFGGFAAEPPDTVDGRVHAAIAEASDTGAARTRSTRGATAFCTSNLLVRSQLMPELRFDENFQGWGWEDVDWAVRAAEAGRLIHVDIPAGHRGWQSVEQLLKRYREAAGNYARLLSKHPELASLPGARAARSLRSVPGQSALRGLWQGLARSNHVPMRVRTIALKLWRASWAAEAMTR